MKAEVIENRSSCENASFLDWSAKEFDYNFSWALVSGMLLINIGTVVCNIIVITRILFQSKHKLFTKYFLITLAISDILLGLTIMPFTIFGMFYDTRALLGDSTCDVANSLDVMGTILSISSLSILSFERYIAICWPFKYERLCSKRAMVSLSVCSVTVAVVTSFGLIIPNYHKAGVEYIALCFEELECHCVFVMNQYYAIISTTFTIVLPGACIVWFNVNIMKQVNRSENIVTMVTAGQNVVHARSMRVARTIFMLTICFLVCWVPFNVCVVVDVLSGYVLPNYVIWAVTWLGYANSMLNPILYLLLESKSCIGRS